MANASLITIWETSRVGGSSQVPTPGLTVYAEESSGFLIWSQLEVDEDWFAVNTLGFGVFQRYDTPGSAVVIEGGFVVADLLAASDVPFAYHSRWFSETGGKISTHDVESGATIYPKAKAGSPNNIVEFDTVDPATMFAGLATTLGQTNVIKIWSRN